jgi:hypothetical protein
MAPGLAMRGENVRSAVMCFWLKVKEINLKGNNGPRTKLLGA